MIRKAKPNLRGRAGSFGPMAILTGALFVLALHAGDSFGQAPSIARTSEDAAPKQRLLRAHIVKCYQDLDRLEKRMLLLHQDLQRLLEEVEKVQPAQESEEPPSGTEESKEVHDRPPFRRPTDKDQIAFVCLERRVNYCSEAPTVIKRASELLGRGPEQSGAEEPIRFDLPDCNLQFEIKTKRHEEGITRELFVANKPGHLGGTWEEIKTMRSPFRRKLASGNPEEQYVTFLVWPDSYAVFHEVRVLAREAGYEIGWILRKPGDPLPFGVGGEVE